MLSKRDSPPVTLTSNKVDRCQFLTCPEYSTLSDIIGEFHGLLNCTMYVHYKKQIYYSKGYEIHDPGHLL